MAKKVKIAALFVIAAILVATFSAISVVQAKTIKGVSQFEVTEEGNVDSCKLKWSKVGGADGYYIHRLNKETGDFEKFYTVEDGKAKEQTLTNLDPATVYQFKIQAFKNYRDKELQSDMSQALTVYTKPQQLAVKVESEEAGKLSVSWQADAHVSGYELQYSKDPAFSEEATQTQKIGDPAAGSYTVESLEEKAEYAVRVRAVLQVNEKKTAYGDWSESAAATVAETMQMPADIDQDKPMVALTFDDGPAYNGATERILDVLEKYHARATFFMVGSRINKKTSPFLKREQSLGCELGNHTYDHEHYGSKVTAADISKCSDAVEKAAGKRPTAFRCPGGRISAVMQDTSKKENMLIAYWSVDTEDWKSKNPSKIYDKATKNVYDGSIILMHDIYTTTADAVEKIVPKLIKDGYQLVTVSELIEAKTGKKPEAGQQYVDYKTINNHTK